MNAARKAAPTTEIQEFSPEQPTAGSYRPMPGAPTDGEKGRRKKKEVFGHLLESEYFHRLSS
jgi:hypothetical protein